MLPLVKTLIDLLTRDTVRVQEVNTALGDVISGGAENVPFTLRPHEAGVKSAQVVRQNAADGVSHVELQLAQPLAMTELVKAFGAFQNVPRSPTPTVAPRVVFYATPSGRSHTAAIFASYDPGSHNAEDGRVTQIMIRRD